MLLDERGRTIGLDDLPKFLQRSGNSRLPIRRFIPGFRSGDMPAKLHISNIGYSFGDEHINRVIEDMLTIPSTHLVIISYNDPMGRIMKTYEKAARPAQTTLLVGNHLGDLKNAR